MEWTRKWIEDPLGSPRTLLDGSALLHEGSTLNINLAILIESALRSLAI